MGIRADHGEAQRYLRDVVLTHKGNECLIWPFSRKKGYAVVWDANTQVTVYASRLVCAQHNGPAPSPLHEALHSCGNGHMGCVAMTHLRWGTRVENIQDAQMHGTLVRGESRNNAKLTDGKVMSILTLKGTASNAAIGAHFGVSETTIRGIYSGKKWPHVDRTVIRDALDEVA